MKYAFSVPTRTDDERSSLFSQFTAAGYDGLQLKRGQFQNFLDTPDQFVGRWGGHPGVASGLIVGGALDEPGIAALRRAISFASRVGSERVVFCHLLARDGLTSDDIRHFAKTLSDIGAEARDGGIALSLHHHYNQPVMHREDFDVFFDAVDDGTVSLTVDTAHLVKSGIHDIAEIIRAFRHVIDNFHMKDIADGEFRILGQGAIDFEPVFTAIRDIGFNGWLCADEESGGDINQTLSYSYAFLQNGLVPA